MKNDMIFVVFRVKKAFVNLLIISLCHSVGILKTLKNLSKVSLYTCLLQSSKPDRSGCPPLYPGINPGSTPFSGG